MKTVILCGGKGERLREETEFKPKPLIQVGGMPILWHIMKIYSHFGHKDFVLLLGYKGYMIKEFFLNFEHRAHDFTLKLHGADSRISFHRKENLEDWTITFLDTGQNTMTGGRISRARDIVGKEDFFLTYGDGLTDLDINTLYGYHKKKGKAATLTGVSPSSPFGIIELVDGLARSFKEKPRLDGTINGGFMVCSRKFFDYVTDDENCVLEETPLKSMARDGELAVYKHDGFWTAMDTYKQVQGLNRTWGSGKVPWKVWE